MNRAHHRLLLIAGLALLAGCTHLREDDALYARLGGEAGIERIVSDLVDVVTIDPRTRRSLEGIKVKHLKHSITMFICNVAGGQCDYEGEDMKKTHVDAQITEAEFDALVGMLREVLDRHVGTAEKNELLRRLAPMKRDIVAGY
ncbi:Globin-like protein [Methyloversatilis universalis FAM5]|uniref:Globin-like protein n=1 Tax=Methyloversatilis universalis (strain ATCC BAA-1314 / DSM 25237 / JCM 13912 / CCUG 52030 / FAM5) TaxID=1000565 RepID=F5RDF2_METUF|nr:group 1 truncated hemoglobin [Methyloversatilis universalis]EGK70933.1 Globin-like protein [Methyloversatilis universalis FAM5]